MSIRIKVKSLLSTIKKSPSLSIVFLWIRYLRNCFRYAKNSRFNFETSMPYRQITLEQYRNTFCGYYDISPFNKKDSSLILVHANNASINYKTDGEKKSDIFLYNWQENKIIAHVGATRAWNWQQGARAGWYSPSTVIYNDFRNGKYCGILFDVDQRKSCELKYPVQSWSDTHYAALSYEILAERRADYGYFCHKRKPSLEDVNIKVLDFSTESVIYEINWKEALKCLKYSENPEILRTIHFNHIQFSPDGSKIAFLVRFDVNRLQHSSLFIADIFSRKVDIPVFDEIISHHIWQSPDEIVYWGKHKGQEGYFKAILESGTSKIISLTQPDGHPVIISRDEFITDSYPDSRMRRQLYRGDMQGKFTKLAEYVEQPVLYVENRCDSHPSLSHDQKWVQIDRMNKGKRYIMISGLS
ncbi:MAG: hypothetical protein GX089_10890 [Fibrobacter sp.]|nr:hypothetical protein [Fibrobacter sp.]